MQFHLSYVSDNRFLLYKFLDDFEIFKRFLVEFLNFTQPLLNFCAFDLEYLSFYRVLMKGITWARDSHGLFDYESRHLTKNTMKTN